jgi:hypothetical protein
MAKKAAKQKAPTVWKTEVFQLIDRLSSDRALLERAVTALRDGASLVDVGVASRALEGDDERKKHVAKHWLGDERLQRVLGQALLRAGELALERRLPIDAYWVFAGKRPRAAVSWNDRQVTLIVVRPAPTIPKKVQKAKKQARSKREEGPGPPPPPPPQIEQFR